jgi:hypothetical protein
MRPQKGSAIDGYCRHDDVYLDADTNQHLIECNQCGRWWRCYGDVQDAWSNFLKYGRMDDSNPSTVHISCSREVWPAVNDEVKTVAV